MSFQNGFVGPSWLYQGKS